MSKPISAKSSEHRVLSYEMPRFDLGISKEALDAMVEEKKSKSFQMSEVVKNKTGVKQLELQNLETEVERRVLSKLESVQETAYREAFDLGRQEGKEEAYTRLSAKIEENLAAMTALVASIENLKPELIAQNETHLVQLAFQMASHLAASEISIDPNSTVQIIKQAVELAQSEEEILIKVAPEHLEFMETLRKETKREFEFLKRTKFEADPGVGLGGCVVVTNYGEIDSRFQERVSRLWDTLKDGLVKVKKQLRSVS